jgi:hypothetical protein
MLDTSSSKEIKSTANLLWLEKEKETIMIYGPPKCGKTWAYCSFIEKTIKAGGKVFIINTDAGVSKTFSQYFAGNLDKVKDHVFYYFISDISEAGPIGKEVYLKSTEKDLIIIDLLSDFWEMAQTKFIQDASGGDLSNYIISSSKDSKKFGLFNGQMWQYIKGLHSSILQPFIGRTKCDVIGICAEKDLDVEKAITGKIKNPEYQAAGAKPAGESHMSHQFNTIIYINKLEKGDKHFFQVIGDRGTTVSQNMVTFERNFEKKLEEVRQKNYGVKNG